MLNVTNFGADLYPGTIWGIRTFRRYPEGEGDLYSMSERLRWNPGWNTAKCIPVKLSDLSLHRTVAAPQFPCSCGFYALKHCDDVVGFAPMWIQGLVELKGRIIEHRLGYRAEKARIVGLVRSAKPHLDHASLDMYDVPLYTAKGANKLLLEKGIDAYTVRK